MARIVRIAGLLPVLILILLLPSPAPAQEGKAEEIAWVRSLATGLAKAKEAGRILMICINAEHVDGREDEEPAAKGLREVVYRDPRVVKRSRDFVCVWMTPKSSTEDHGELGNLGVQDPIISPQHIFVTPDGGRVLLRKEYWPHGKGEAAVKELLSMMAEAERRATQPEDEPAPTPERAPAEGDARAEWIAARLAELDQGVAAREKALNALIKADRDGDCTGPLIALLPEKKKDTDFLWYLIRALGRDGLEAAAIPISEFLGHRDPSIRGCAAVSLEYIGSRDKKVVTALLNAAGNQKDEAIANHVCRALGRCGVEDAKARTLLLKKAASGKSEFATYGPAIGLAYFEGDEKAARGVEKILKQMGIPGGGFGGFQNAVKRAVLMWTLANIRDGKSAGFVRVEMIAKLENVKAFWVDGLRRFWVSVAKACEGDDSEMPAVEGGVRITADFARRGAEVKSLMDENRAGRDNLKFKPKGDGLLGPAQQD